MHVCAVCTPWHQHTGLHRPWELPLCTQLFLIFSMRREWGVFGVGGVAELCSARSIIHRATLGLASRLLARSNSLYITTKCVAHCDKITLGQNPFVGCGHIWTISSPNKNQSKMSGREQWRRYPVRTKRQVILFCFCIEKIADLIVVRQPISAGEQCKICPYDPIKACQHTLQSTKNLMIFCRLKLD